MLVLANILQPLIDLNEAILKFWHDTVGFGWGPSIIGLTIVIRLAILPLTFKQVRSMQEMQRFSPEIQRIRERYKDDKTRQNEELMKLYQEHGFNPLSSCLPLVFQLPFFFGLYQTLRSQSFIDNVHNNGGGHFLFIPDITKPLTGHTTELVVMIVIYVGTQLCSSYVSAINVQDKNQKRLLFIFPFVFVPVVINFEAGLLVYWITTNTWTIGQQLFVRRFLPPPEPHIVSSSGGDDKVKGAAEPKGARAATATSGRAARTASGGRSKDTAKESGKAAAGASAKARGASNGGGDGGGPAKA
ncbi:MAG: YidC/Oxa1 family rane protein insertase, partial [Thermoleophilaceae bacterium]|nr:YidC/Oxa1 family rane protein insertase [Thermoleophilaceae bacterium]